MLEHVDRMQLAVRDRSAAADTFAHVLGAVTEPSHGNRIGGGTIRP